MLYMNCCGLAYLEYNVHSIENLYIFNRNSLAAVNACRKLAVNLGDSIELRVILSLLYTITIVLRSHPDTHLRENFVSELSKLLFFSQI